MSRYFEMLMEDVRFREGLKSCMNCGICTGVCPAAEFYDYDPRQIVAIVQTRDEEQIERLLKGDTIWFCGECMSCRPRCPRGNTPGYVIQALRTLSQKLGFFVESEKGRQQLALKRTIGENILRTGYCVTPKLVVPDLHPEQGPVWSWVYRNDPRNLLPVQPHLRPSGAGRRAPNRRRHARRAAPHLRRNGRYGLLREHRTLLRAQGARVGIRRCRRALFHGCIHPQFTERG